MNDRDDSTRNLTLAQKALRDLWEDHIWCEFYSKHFIQQMLPDTEMTPISRTMMAPLLVFQAAQKLLTPLR